MNAHHERVEAALAYLDTFPYDPDKVPEFSNPWFRDNEHRNVSELRRLILNGITEAKVGQPMSELILAHLIAGGWVQPKGETSD